MSLDKMNWCQLNLFLQIYEFLIKHMEVLFNARNVYPSNSPVLFIVRKYFTVLITYVAEFVLTVKCTGKFDR